jgi:hypothetical protein
VAQTPIGEAFRRWASHVVVTNNPDPGPLLGAIRDNLNIDPQLYDRARGLPDRTPEKWSPFLISGPSSTADLKNQVTFELAKVMWYRMNDGDTSTPKTTFGKEFQRLWETDHLVIAEGQFATWHGESLGKLQDRDWQSHFGYAVRACVCNLSAPENVEQKKWDRAKQAVEDLLAPIFKQTITFEGRKFHEQ